MLLVLTRPADAQPRRGRYKGQTEPFHNQGDTEQTRLFLAMVKLHRSFSPFSFARWQTGIDTGIFKPHSVRGAVVSVAASAGVTTSNIFQAADWSLQSFTTSQFGLSLLEQICSPKVGQTHCKPPQLLWQNFSAHVAGASYSGLYMRKRLNI